MVKNQSKVEAVSEVSLKVEVVKILVDMSSTVNVSNDTAAPEVNVEDGCIESTAGFPFKTSAHSTIQKVNR